MRVLHVACTECSARATIKKTVWKDKIFADLYLACSSVECGHTFVMNLTFSHTLSPSVNSKEFLLSTVLNGLNNEQRSILLEQLQNAQ